MKNSIQVEEEFEMKIASPYRKPMNLIINNLVPFSEFDRCRRIFLHKEINECLGVRVQVAESKKCVSRIAKEVDSLNRQINEVKFLIMRRNNNVNRLEAAKLTTRKKKVEYTAMIKALEAKELELYRTLLKNKREGLLLNLPEK